MLEDRVYRLFFANTAITYAQGGRYTILVSYDLAVFASVDTLLIVIQLCCIVTNPKLTPARIDGASQGAIMSYIVQSP